MDWKNQSEAFWRERLTPEQFEILRKKGTERPFSGQHCQSHSPGTYLCAGCDQELFVAHEKFDSGTGWPSFTQPLRPEAIETHLDHSHGMVRVEVCCAQCGGHLGHVFEDGPAPAGLRYCINSLSLKHRSGRH
ncbi:MAG: peptide-methionine (R)-S-oxide reductase MsrB [Bdellovibrionales bacterium]|nr:peptide-methionine (R)-S-oxide reductase MsrB [Bdellovibrionales bacterium]